METGIQSVPRVDASPDLEIRKKRLRESCREFESVMVSYLMKTMREGVVRAEEPEHAQAIYEEMLDGQFSKTMATKGALGIGDMLYARLEHLVEARQATGTTDDKPAPHATEDSAVPQPSVPATPSSVVEPKEFP